MDHEWENWINYYNRSWIEFSMNIYSGDPCDGKKLYALVCGGS